MPKPSRTNPHATSGTGTPRDPWIYPTFARMTKGQDWDPNRGTAQAGWHELTDEAKTRLNITRSRVEREMRDAINAEVARRLLAIEGE